MTKPDLSYKEIENPNPSTLTAEQVSSFNEHGYVKPFAAYDGEGANQQRAYFDRIIRRVQEERPDLDSYAINGWHTACRGIYDVVMNPLILDHVEDLLGPDFLAWGTHYFCKLPHDPKRVAWHQDASYWPLTPARTITAWVAIDDADRGNSAMMFMPGTHRQGHLKWHHVEEQVVLNQEVSDIEQYGEPVYDELKAGEFSLHADMLAHGSEANASDRRRCGLTIRYCPPSVVPIHPGWGSNGILCRGSADGSAWTFPPVPEGDNIQARIEAIGGN
ncbi:MAG: phytanoyl-CoA dioxygenase family protein [Verrucomicrobia bacterium]|nr:phytanoyl-CoA dioxygenase family protein [Verrucomicrobiota bacterium]MDA1088648.1 phytanoyl-CoA dioxygenase family protein [Verrucomicrobiota bacterium]